LEEGIGKPAFARVTGVRLGMAKYTECTDADPPGADAILGQEPDEEEEEGEGDSKEDDDEDDTDDGYSE